MALGFRDSVSWARAVPKRKNMESDRPHPAPTLLLCHPTPKSLSQPRLRITSRRAEYQQFTSLEALGREGGDQGPTVQQANGGQG